MEDLELTFPCDYAIKVIGQDEEDFEEFVREVVDRHISGVQPEHFSTKSSRESNYLSVSVAFLAESRAQLNTLYGELGADPRVKLIL